jgi:hypothetical protein
LCRSRRALLDFLILSNFSFALLILLLTFYTAAARVLDLSIAAAGRHAVPAVAQRVGHALILERCRRRQGDRRDRLLRGGRQLRRSG